MTLDVHGGVYDELDGVGDAGVELEECLMIPPHVVSYSRVEVPPLGIFIIPKDIMPKVDKVSRLIE
jgi:hypothetical protein